MCCSTWTVSLSTVPKMSGRCWQMQLVKRSRLAFSAVACSSIWKSVWQRGQGAVDMGIGEVGELLRRSTVHIRSLNRRAQSAGSGVIWNGDGTIVTNAHVLGTGAHSVELWDGRTFPAELKERDDHRD